MDATKPYKFIGFGAMDVTKPCKFTGFGAMDVTKSYKIYRLWGRHILMPDPYDTYKRQYGLRIDLPGFFR